MNTIEYDKRGLLTRITDPLENSTIYSYTDAGKLSHVIDRNNDRVDFTYTPTGKVETIKYQDVVQISFDYDGKNDHLTGMHDSLGTTIYSHDALYRLKSIDDPNGFNVSYVYDTAVDTDDQPGNLSKTIYPDGKEVSYTYDKLNRLETITNWLGQTATYSYDEAGRLAKFVNFNGTVTTYGYDKANRLTSMENRKADNGEVISSYIYSLDGNGNRAQVNQNEPLVPLLSASSTSFDYNEKKNRLVSAGTSNFAYDDEGQLTDKDGTVYTFDYAHRLTNVGTDQFFYDGFGNRLKAVRDGVTTYYIYDAAGNLLAEADGSKNITRYYIHGAGLLAMVEGGQVYCYHFNGVGSTIAMTDQAKNPVNKYAYTPFGRLENKEEPMIVQPFKFVGQFGVMSESNDSLIYMRARYYDASTGRFISEDPIGFAGGDVNLYRYVSNNPVVFVDPSGLIWVTVRYDYHVARSYPRWWLNRFLYTEDKRESMPGSNIREYHGATRDIIQEWQHDPDNPERDSEHPIGTRRRIQQTYEEHSRRLNDNDLVNDRDSQFYYRWEPVVNSPTYKEYNECEY